MNKTNASVQENPRVTKGVIFFMAVACGFTVANVYLNQVLLVSMGKTFNVAAAASIGIVATLTQVGYALGNLLVVPLGDIFERRKLILTLLCAVSFSLAAAAISPNVTWLVVTNFLIGICTVIPQIIVPLVASLVDEKVRGKVLGNVAIGLVCGILGARFVSGLIDVHFGWRAMYWASFASMLVIIVLTRLLLPKSQGVASMKYSELLTSLGPMFIQEKVLRQACISQGVIFGVFSVFWTTLGFLLQSPSYSYGSDVVGLVGLVGIGGAFATPIIGRVIDKKGPIYANTLCMTITFIAFIISITLGYWLTALILSALLVTVGTQANQVACQARIFQLSPDKRSRLNGLYMVATFLGRALGSYIGVLAWSNWGWLGVCITGMVMVSLGFTSLLNMKNEVKSLKMVENMKRGDA